MKTAEEKRQTIAHSNEVVFEHLLENLQHGQFNGQIVLHVNHGVIRKVERQEVFTTASLLANGEEP